VRSVHLRRCRLRADYPRAAVVDRTGDATVARQAQESMIAVAPVDWMLAEAVHDLGAVSQALVLAATRIQVPGGWKSHMGRAVAQTTAQAGP
jgi:hypothetical protein